MVLEGAAHALGLPAAQVPLVAVQELHIVPVPAQCSVVGRQVRPGPEALALPRPPLLHRAYAIVVGKTQRVGPCCTQPCALGHVGVVEVRGALTLQQRLEVQAAVDQSVLHAEVVPRGQHLVTRSAHEAVEVINQVQARITIPEAEMPRWQRAQRCTENRL